MYILILFFTVSTGYSQNNNASDEIRRNLDLCKMAQSNNLADSSLHYSREAYNGMLQSGVFEDKALVLYHYAKSYYLLSEFDSAAYYYNLTIAEAELQRDYARLAASYNDLGRLNKKKSVYSEALKNFNLARRFYNIVNDSTGIALVNLNVGNVLKSVGQSELAKIEYHKALNYFTRNGDKNNEAGCCNNLGNIFKNDKQFDSAFYYMYRTLHIRENGDSKTGLAFIYHNLANLHLALHHTDSALHYISKSFDINSALQSPDDISYDYNVYGSIYMELKDWNKAIFYLEKANELTRPDEITENKLDILKQLGIAYYRAGKMDKSASSFVDFFVLNDSLNILNQDSFIESELTRYTIFADSLKIEQLKLERDLEVAKTENTKLANSINFRNYFYALIILFLILAMIGILFINARRNLIRTREHEAVLKKQNEELKRTLISKEEKEILLKEIHHRVKNNLQIINSLIRLQSNFMNANNFREKLTETENRIRSMALIHEKLYKTGNLASLSVKNYIEELAFNILESYDNHKVKIRLRFDLEEREYGIDTLIPLGLIINEIVSNSLKHAFFERTDGNIFISIQSNGTESVMIISDDGIGADMTYDELKEDSLGMELIDSLVDQLDGKLKLETAKGFEYKFVFTRLK